MLWGPYKDLEIELIKMAVLCLKYIIKKDSLGLQSLEKSKYELL